MNDNGMSPMPSAISMPVLRCANSASRGYSRCDRRKKKTSATSRTVSDSVSAKTNAGAS